MSALPPPRARSGTTAVRARVRASGVYLVCVGTHAGPAQEPERVERRSATTRHGFERMVFFSDAVVAIAVTLVILPLVDRAQDIGRQTVGRFLLENLSLIGAATVSFVIVSALWRSHHRLFERATGYVPSLLHINAWWIGSIAALPVTTVLSVDAPETDRGGDILYVLSLMSATLALFVIWRVLSRHGLLEPPARPTDDLVVVRLIPIALLAVVFGCVIAVPDFVLWPLLLVLNRPIAALIARAHDRRTRPHPVRTPATATSTAPADEPPADPVDASAVPSDPVASVNAPDPRPDPQAPAPSAAKD